MPRDLSAIRQTVRQVLRDEFVPGSTQDWQDDEIDIQIGLCLDEISQHSPNIVREVLTTIEDSRELDISGIDNLLAIVKAEYPTGNSPKDYRNIIWLDNETIEIDTTRTPDAGGSGTLTGTVTFAEGSTAVTGSGTDFDGELEAGYHIKKSTGTRWYRIKSITDDTNLVLDEVCRSVDDGADTADVTQYCYETVYLYCNKLHELTESSSSLKASEERVLIDGSIAYTALAWIGSIRGHIREAVSLLTSSKNAIDNISDRIEQSIDDLTSGRAQIDDLRATVDTTIDNMSARILEAINDLDLGQTYINKVNYGGNPENDYANYAARELSNANTYLNQARGYLSESTTADKFGASAARELQNASSYLNQAGGYIRQASSRLSIAGAVNTYQTWANNKLVLYQRALSRITKSEDYEEYPKS